MIARAWPWLNGVPCVNGVHRMSGPSPFEEAYGAVRSKEDRILDDAQVRGLPNGAGLWNAREWRIRRSGAERLMEQLGDHGGAKILEVGCGNGWLSAYLHRADHHVVGIDPFTMELEQAARVFPNGPVFVRADLFASPLPPHGFDAVVFAASIQYFGDMAGTLRRAAELVQPGGSIHVLDTVLYPDASEASAAQQRSRAYYAELGHPEMAENYHAHTLGTALGMPHARVIDGPSSFARIGKLLGGTASPFTHVEIGAR